MKKKRSHCITLAKKVALKRDNCTCKRCGRDKEAGWQMHGSHIKGVGAYPNLSYKTRNIKCLCASCHRWWHDVPTESGLWFKEKFPEWHKEIREMMLAPAGQPDYEKEYKSLQEEMKALTSD